MPTSEAPLLTLLTAGTRGDVQPYLALGLGLRAAGYRVRLATHAEFRDLVESYGLELFPIRGNPREMMESPEGQRLLSSGMSYAFVKRFGAVLDRHIVDLVEDSRAACEGAAAVIFSSIGFFGGYAAGELLRIPAIAAYLLPTHPTRAFPSPMFPPPPVWLPAPRFFNHLTHLAAGYGFWNLVRSTVNTGRAKLGLPPQGFFGPFPEMERQRFPVVYGYSAHVVPKPDDWGDWIDVTGYWFLDEPEGFTPPPELEAFLADGSPPVYVGFGSMKQGDPKEVTRLVVRAFELSGQRGLLLGGWGGLARAELPPTVMHVDQAPHSWLFPKMAAVVHHGGAGTTAAALRAGVPSVVVPFFADQPFWAQRVLDLGAGPPPVPRQTLTADALANAIEEAVTNARIQERAREVGRLLRAEHGVERAVERIGRVLASQRRER